MPSPESSREPVRPFDASWSALPLPIRLLVLGIAGLLVRREADAIAYLREENRVLREHLTQALEGRCLRLSDEERARLAQRGQALGLARLRELAGLVTPETILRWYRELVARKYDGSPKRVSPKKGLAVMPGRPPTPAELAALVVRLARENPTFGYTRIAQTLASLGHEIGRSTVGAILQRAGLDPATGRGRQPTWAQFLEAHRAGLAAADFFSVEVLTWLGIVRYQVFFVLRLATREVQVAGFARDGAATADWVLQLVRNLTDGFDGFLKGYTHLILDRDPLYTQRVRDLLGASGVTVVRTAPRSPNQNAFAERWIGSARRECLDRVIVLGERHLERLLRGFEAHYNRERPHQALDGRMLDPDPRIAAGAPQGPVRCAPRLGGLLRLYHRAPARHAA